jgi:hypothetical protein
MEFYSHCGGLPAPEASDNPLRLKVSRELPMYGTILLTLSVAVLLVTPGSFAFSAELRHFHPR